MTITELEQAVTKLSPQDLNHFRKWFDEDDAQMWDKQIESDAKSGKLDKLVEQALSDYRAGKARER